MLCFLLVCHGPAQGCVGLGLVLLVWLVVVVLVWGGPAAASRFVVCSCALVDRNEGRPGDQKNESRERCALYMFVMCLCVFCGPNSGPPGGLNFEHVQALRHVHVFCCFLS